MQNQSSHQLSPLEIENLRAVLARADGEAARKGMVEFDLNNPPTKPYRHQEYPKSMHHHDKRVVKIANSIDEQILLEAKGYQEAPFPPAEGYDKPDELLSTADQTEIAELEARIAEDKAKKKNKAA